MKRAVLIILFLVFGVNLVFAARPMITDDARVVDEHSCQLETWGQYSHQIGEFWAIAGCNFIYDVEISFGGLLSNEPTQTMSDHKTKWSGRKFVIGAKKVLKDLETDGYSFGLALGNAYNFRQLKNPNDFYLYAPISKAFFDNRLFVHANLGYKLEHNPFSEHIYNIGLGLEQEVSQRVWILAESIYERLDTPKYQFGLRIWLMPDRIQLDGTYGNAFKGGQSWVSVGLRFLGPQMY